MYGLGSGSGASIWLWEHKVESSTTHVGFAAPNRAAVDAAYEAAIKAGAKDNGSPAVRHYFTDGYYAANVFDPDGHSIEFVHKS